MKKYNENRLGLKAPNGFAFVRTKGLEPPRRVAPDPKSDASTNSATPA